MARVSIVHPLYCMTTTTIGFLVRRRRSPSRRPPHFFPQVCGSVFCSSSPMSRFQHDDYLGVFQHPPYLYDVGPPEQIAFYSCFINDTNDYRFNDHSALRRYKGGELRLPLQLETAADRDEFYATSARIDQVPRPSLAPVITACLGSGDTTSVLNADVIARRGALSR